MKDSFCRFTSLLALIGAAAATQAFAAPPYTPLAGDTSVTIVAGAPPSGAIGLSVSATGEERAVYYRPGLDEALFIGEKNNLPKGCKPTEFKDDDGSTIPTWVKLDCAGKAWQAKLSKTGKIFTVKSL